MCRGGWAVARPRCVSGAGNVEHSAARGRVVSIFRDRVHFSRDTCFVSTVGLTYDQRQGQRLRSSDITRSRVTQARLFTLQSSQYHSVYRLPQSYPIASCRHQLLRCHLYHWHGRWRRPGSYSPGWRAFHRCFTCTVDQVPLWRQGERDVRSCERTCRSSARRSHLTSDWIRCSPAQHASPASRSSRR